MIEAGLTWLTGFPSAVCLPEITNVVQADVLSANNKKTKKTDIMISFLSPDFEIITESSLSVVVSTEADCL